MRSLNLACNRLEKLENLAGLRRLSHLNLAYNRIKNLSGLTDLWGVGYSLETLSLSANYLSSTDECTYYLSGLVKLKYLSLDGNEFNKDYRSTLFGLIKGLISIDGKDRFNRAVEISPNSQSQVYFRAIINPIAKK